MASYNFYTNSNLKKFAVRFFFTFFIIKVLEALCFFRHGDALNYHLVGPRFWLETNWLEMTKDLWGNFQSGYFEVFYLITIGLFGNTLWGQLSSQLLHFLLGQGLAALILYKYFSNKGKTIVGVLAGMSVLTIAKSGDFFLYAKNDGVLAACGLLVSLLIVDESFLKLKGIRRSLLIGFLLGLIPSIKMSGLFLIAPLALYFSYIKRNNFKEVILAGLVAALTFTPLLLRNYYFIGNPLFPGLIKVFPGVLTEEMKAYYLYHMSSELTWSSLFSALKSFFTGKVLFLAFLPIVFLQLIKRKIPILGLISLIVFGLYLIVNGGLVVERFFFICYFLIIYTIFTFLNEKKVKDYQIVILLVLILIDSKIDKSIKRITHYFPRYLNEVPLDIVYQESPYARLWKDVTAAPSNTKQLILSDLFAQQFYAPKGLRIHQYRGRPDVEFLGKCNQNDLIKLNKYSYAILAENNFNLCYQKIRNEGTVISQVDNFVLYKL